MKSNREMYDLCVQRRWDEIINAVESNEWQAASYLTDPSLGTEFSLLVCAAQDGLVNVVKALIKHGANPNDRIRGAQSALMIAGPVGHDSVVEVLLNAGADVHKKWRGETVLMMAAAQNRRDIVKRLLDAGARVMDRDRKGQTALSYAATRGSIDSAMITLLVDAGSPVDGRDLHVPVALRDAEVVQLLLSKGPDVNARFDWTSFGAAPVVKGTTPLHVAAADTVRESMIKAGAPIGSLQSAERLAIVESLLDGGADVDIQSSKTGWTPLLLATHYDEAEIAAALIRAGADPHQEFECKVKRFPLSKPRTLVETTLSAVRLAEMRPRNKRVRKLLLG